MRFQFSAGMARAPNTCFGNQLSGPQESNEASSTVFIVARDKGGPAQANGSAAVVRGSGNAANPLNRLVTAYHVVNPSEFKANPLVEVYSSAGVALGKARLVVSGTNVLAKDGGGAQIANSDAAVLEMVEPPPAGWDAYKQIQGLTLARQQTQYLLTGFYDTPGGIDHGASGGPSVDSSGHLLAVTSYTTKEVGEYGASDLMTINFGNAPRAETIQPSNLKAAWLTQAGPRHAVAPRQFGRAVRP